tara:strand:- start:345 stop:659 length:315 start_codon:yes stop_codon:yes gene_type:complete
MNIWIVIIITGIINYLTRLGSVLIFNPKKIGKNTKQVLNFVPSAVFPAIIFPAVFFDNSGTFVEFNDPKVVSILIAFMIGFITKNLVITILSGLSIYWVIIFLI